ncbi:MAG TPA: HPF/RaiA family ribosome-associated protein [Rhizomicrobium sp.]|jgi:ribosome-associated translation inhibitor RaiA|nr:HPF/RaiA family ribosome-associated protein [Rhizomicrobium sp.]
MDIPLELSFHNMQPSDALKAAVQKHVRKLDSLKSHLIGCRVVIEMPHKNHRTGQNLPDVHIVMRVPGKELVVSREMAHAGNKKTPTDAYAVLDNAFAVAQSQLKEHRRIVQGDVKYKSGETRGGRENALK